MDSPDLTVVLFSRRRGCLRDFTLRSLLADGIQAESVVIKQHCERPFDCTDIPSRFIAFMNEGDLWLKGKCEAMVRTLKDAPACSHLLYPAQYFDVPIKALVKSQSFPTDNPYYASALAFRSEMLDKVSFHSKNNRVYADTGRQVIRLLPEVFGTACPEPNIGLLPRMRKACQARRQRPGFSLESIRDCFKGRRCFIIGNGPSLKDTDLSRLKNEVSFASNSFNLLFPQLGWRPNVYACIDTLVLPDRAQELGDLAQQCPSTRLFLPLFLPTRGPARSAHLTLYGLGLGFYLLLAPITNLTRYVLPVLGLLAAGAGIVIASLPGRLLRAAFGVALALLLARNAAFEWEKLQLLRPALYLSGEADRLEWLERVGFNFTPAMASATRALNRELQPPPEQGIFMIGEGKGRLLENPYLPDSTWYMQRWLAELLNARSGDRIDYREIARSLRSQGVGYLLINRGYFDWVVRNTDANLSQVAFGLVHLQRFASEHGARS